MTQVPHGLLEVGRIGKPHGVRGDLFISLTSDVEERRAVGATFTVTEGGGTRNLTVVSIRPQQDRWVVHFEGIDDRNAAEKLVNKFLYAEPVSESDALWVHELIGSQVVDQQGSKWGTCTGVLHNPAHDLLEIDNELLVPLPFVISCDGTTTVIHPPEGFREVLMSDNETGK